MTTEELAEELYNLIVIKGRHRERSMYSLTSSGYPGQPEWLKDLWCDQAVQFAKENNFTLEDA